MQAHAKTSQNSQNSQQSLGNKAFQQKGLNGDQLHQLESPVWSR